MFSKKFYAVRSKKKLKERKNKNKNVRKVEQRKEDQENGQGGKI